MRGKESQWEMKEVKEIQEKVDMRTNSKDVVVVGGRVLLLRLLEQQMGIDKQSQETNFINEKGVVVLRRLCHLFCNTRRGGS